MSITRLSTRNQSSTPLHAKALGHHANRIPYHAATKFIPFQHKGQSSLKHATLKSDATTAIMPRPPRVRTRDQRVPTFKPCTNSHLSCMSHAMPLTQCRCPSHRLLYTPCKPYTLYPTNSIHYTLHTLYTFPLRGGGGRPVRSPAYR